MKPKFASFLVLLLAVAFVSVAVPWAAEKDHDTAKTAVEQATQEQAGRKVEIKGKLEEEKGTTTLELKKIKPEADASEAAAASERPE